MFSKRLADLRKKRGLSQYELAKRLGCTRGQIGNYEQGTREPDHEMLTKIANFFDVSVDYLLGRTDNSIPEDIKKAMQAVDPNDPDWKKAVELYKEVQEGKNPVYHGIDITKLLELPTEEKIKIIRRLLDTMMDNQQSTQNDF